MLWKQSTGLFLLFFILGRHFCTPHELDPRLCGCESPAVLSGAVLSLSFPCYFFVMHHANVCNTTLKAFGLYDAQFDFGHIEPTAVLRPSSACVAGNPHKTKPDFFSSRPEKLIDTGVAIFFGLGLYGLGVFGAGRAATKCRSLSLRVGR